MPPETLQLDLLDCTWACDAMSGVLSHEMALVREGMWYRHRQNSRRSPQMAHTAVAFSYCVK